METKIIERYFFFFLLLVTLILSLFIFSPFWVVLLLGISFSVVLYPVYEWFNKKLPSWLASLLTVLFFIIIIGIPLFAIGALVFDQSKDAYHSIATNIDSSTFIDSINTSINNLLPEGITFNLYEKISSFTSVISNNIAKVFTSTLEAVFSLVLTLLSIFYFLKDGESWKKALIILSPLSDADDKKIISRFSNSINGIMKGYLFVAFLQGLLMGVGLSIFGVPNPALWGLVAMFASLVPSIGTAMISIPAIIFLFAIGQNNNAIGLIIWSSVIVGLIDNFLSPVIIGHKMNLPPLLMLFSVLGGISLLGPIGLIVGPLTISLLYTLISIYRNEFRQQSLNS